MTIDIRSAQVYWRNLARQCQEIAETSEDRGHVRLLQVQRDLNDIISLGLQEAEREGLFIDPSRGVPDLLGSGLPHPTKERLFKPILKATNAAFHLDRIDEWKAWARERGLNPSVEALYAYARNLWRFELLGTTFTITRAQTAPVAVKEAAVVSLGGWGRTKIRRGGRLDKVLRQLNPHNPEAELCERLPIAATLAWSGWKAGDEEQTIVTMTTNHILNEQLLNAGRLEDYSSAPAPDDVLDLVLTRTLAQEWLREFERIPQRQQVALILVDGDDPQSYADAATIMGISVEGLKTNLAEGRRKVRQIRENLDRK